MQAYLVKISDFWELKWEAEKYLFIMWHEIICFHGPGVIQLSLINALSIYSSDATHKLW